jgi:inorganic pyrophosphatase
LGLLGLGTLFAIYGPSIHDESSARAAMNIITGFSFGASSIALFARVGGGIYTKAADVGADLVGKVEAGIPEDHPLNPATIADNVGDNVGDIAGMGADLFGSFAEATCAALVLVAASEGLDATAPGMSPEKHQRALMYPVMISSLGVVAGFLTLLVVGKAYPVKDPQDVEKALKGILVISTVIMTPIVVWLSYWALPEGAFQVAGLQVQWWYCALCILLGLWSGLAIGILGGKSWGLFGTWVLAGFHGGVLRGPLGVENLRPHLILRFLGSIS